MRLGKLDIPHSGWSRDNFEKLPISDWGFLDVSGFFMTCVTQSWRWQRELWSGAPLGSDRIVLQTNPTQSRFGANTSVVHLVFQGPLQIVRSLPYLKLQTATAHFEFQSIHTEVTV